MKDYLLRYSTMATDSHNGWERQSLPIGNGYMGMCVFGRTEVERLQFNEKTLWTGGPSPKRPDYYGGNKRDMAGILNAFRSALTLNDKTAVNALCKQLTGEQNDGYGAYQTFGDVKLSFAHRGVSAYERGLNLNDATAYVGYVCEGVRYTAKHFASYPDRVIVSTYNADKPVLAVDVSLNIEHKGVRFNVADNQITASGTLEDNGLEYYAVLYIDTDGTTQRADSTVKVTNASHLTLYLAAGTDYDDCFPKYRGASPKGMVEDVISRAREKGLDSLYKAHLKDYKALFDRTFIDLGGSTRLTTDKLVSEYNEAPETDRRYLEELLFAYGRYLIIGSSREGSLPANLQGVWNDSNTPPWNCDYHLNVNLQMCYWHVNTCNISETALPMIRYMDSLRAPGRITAKEYHGITSTEKMPHNGWVCHTQNTPFGWTCPGWSFYWGWSPSAAAWMMQNVYEYYEFTHDDKLLRDTIYPMMKECAVFWLQSLIFDEKQNRYVSSPTFSPEHGPITIGNTYEQSLICMLFDYVVSAGKIVGEDDVFLKILLDVRSKLNPLSIGRWGQVKEWYEEDGWYKRKFFRKAGYVKHGAQMGHRHTSHLVGLFPGQLINRSTTELHHAAVITLKDRNGRGKFTHDSGWGKVNKIAMWARLGRGNEAYAIIQSLMKRNIGGNLWDLHPPFQMDGNCGYSAAIAEIFLQSYNGVIELLPAVPAVWTSGAVYRLRARGGYTVDIEWKDGNLTNYTVTSDKGDTARVLYRGKEDVAESGKRYSFTEK